MHFYVNHWNCASCISMSHQNKIPNSLHNRITVFWLSGIYQLLCVLSVTSMYNCIHRCVTLFSQFNASKYETVCLRRHYCTARFALCWIIFHTFIVKFDWLMNGWYCFKNYVEIRCWNSQYNYWNANMMFLEYQAFDILWWLGSTNFF